VSALPVPAPRALRGSLVFLALRESSIYLVQSEGLERRGGGGDTRKCGGKLPREEALLSRKTGIAKK